MCQCYQFICGRQRSDNQCWASQAMALSSEEFVKRLDAISESDDVPYGRAHLLFDEEQKHQQAILQYKGYLALSNASKCFFLETVCKELP
jgi:hypothetical protein